MPARGDLGKMRIRGSGRPIMGGKGRPRGRSVLSSAERHERKEELLRPSPFLGYDREALALHLLARGAHALAEVQLRRMVWLNPFEPRFKANLALCLSRGGNTSEALSMIEFAAREHPGDQRILRARDAVLNSSQASGGRRPG